MKQYMAHAEKKRFHDVQMTTILPKYSIRHTFDRLDDVSGSATLLRELFYHTQKTQLKLMMLWTIKIDVFKLSPTGDGLRYTTEKLGRLA